MSTDDRPIASTDRPASSEPIVRCEDVVREYVRGRRGRDGPRVTALVGISLDVSANEAVGVAGPSGSGKSTLLHLLAGLDVPTRGRVTLAGTDTAALSGRERTRLRLDHVGVVFQRFHLLPSLTARANVAVPLIERGVDRATRRARADALLERVGLDGRADHRPGELSGGEQQRVAIARALVTDPSLLVADEPTGELDSATGAAVLDLMTDLASDRAVVIASHDVDALSRVDRVVRLHDGRIVDRDERSDG